MLHTAAAYLLPTIISQGQSTTAQGTYCVSILFAAQQLANPSQMSGLF